MLMTTAHDDNAEDDDDVVDNDAGIDCARVQGVQLPEGPLSAGIHAGTSGRHPPAAAHLLADTHAAEGGPVPGDLRLSGQRRGGTRG